MTVEVVVARSGTMARDILEKHFIENKPLHLAALGNFEHFVGHIR